MQPMDKRRICALNSVAISWIYRKTWRIELVYRRPSRCGNELQFRPRRVQVRPDSGDVLRSTGAQISDRSRVQPAFSRMVLVLLAVWQPIVSDISPPARIGSVHHKGPALSLTNRGTTVQTLMRWGIVESLQRQSPIRWSASLKAIPLILLGKDNLGHRAYQGREMRSMSTVVHPSGSPSF